MPGDVFGQEGARHNGRYFAYELRWDVDDEFVRFILQAMFIADGAIHHYLSPGNDSLRTAFYQWVTRVACLAICLPVRSPSGETPQYLLALDVDRPDRADSFIHDIPVGPNIGGEVDLNPLAAIIRIDGVLLGRPRFLKQLESQCFQVRAATGNEKKARLEGGRAEALHGAMRETNPVS
jgi:hypothetical protein